MIFRESFAISDGALERGLLLNEGCRFPTLLLSYSRERFRDALLSAGTAGAPVQKNFMMIHERGFRGMRSLWQDARAGPPDGLAKTERIIR